MVVAGLCVCVRACVCVRVLIPVVAVGGGTTTAKRVVGIHTVMHMLAFHFYAYITRNEDNKHSLLAHCEHPLHLLHEHFFAQICCLEAQLD